MPMGPAVEEYFQEVSLCVRAQNERVTVKTEGNLYSQRIKMVDRSFFDAFTFPLKRGNPSSVFSQENSIVLTENYARKYFGESDPPMHRVYLSMVGWKTRS